MAFVDRGTDEWRRMWAKLDTDDKSGWGWGLEKDAACWREAMGGTVEAQIVGEGTEIPLADKVDEEREEL